MARKNKGYPILAPLVARTLVMPSVQANELGWDDPEKWKWPGEVVHEMTTVSGKNVVQFLVWEKVDRHYVLKTWDKKYLCLARQKDLPETTVEVPPV